MLFLVASLTLQNRSLLWPVVACAIAASLLLTWSYWKAPAPLRLKSIAALLKLSGICLLLSCFLEPAWTGENARPGANLFAVVADNSESLILREEGELESRFVQLQRLLVGGESTWRSALARSFTVRNYLFDTSARQTADFKDLTGTGSNSAIVQALQTVASQANAQPLAGMLLFTDGIGTDTRSLGSASTLPPIYPVVLGDKAPAVDLGIVATSISQTAFEDAPVTLQASVEAHGLSNREVEASLSELKTSQGSEAKAPLPVARETAVVSDQGGKINFRLQFRPSRSGILFYKLVVNQKGTAVNEATLANNEAIVSVERQKGPYRILYTGGRPNWEYKFLHRAIEEDDQTQLVSLMRIAKREPKFEFRGRGGESSNPLFRGFGNQDKEQTEQYDQPVFVRLGTEDEKELSGGFPKTPEELFRYSALVIHDVEADFFSPQQMLLIRRFVSERGGTLLMMGGAEGFLEGHYQHTALGDLLPVYLDRKTSAPPAGVPLQLGLTREGWLQPWVRLRDTEALEQQRLRELPPNEVLNHVGTTKPAATVLATVSDGQQQFPALVTQPLGRGRSAALLVGDLWQLGLGDEVRGKDLAKGWRQLLRWMVADVPERIAVQVEPSTDRYGMRISVRARDRGFLPMENAEVTIKVEHVRTDGHVEDEISLQGSPADSEPGLYETTFVPRESGGYRVTAVVRGIDSGEQMMGEGGWSTNLALDEFKTLAPDRTTLEALARRTGGRVVEAKDLDRFIQELPNLRAPVVDRWTRPLWHTPYVFILALAMLLGEWWLRRSRGLA